MRVANSDQQLHRLLRLSTPGEIVPNQRLVIQYAVHQHQQTAGRVPTRTLVRLRNQLPNQDASFSSAADPVRHQSAADRIHRQFQIIRCAIQLGRNFHIAALQLSLALHLK